MNHGGSRIESGDRRGHPDDRAHHQQLWRMRPGARTSWSESRSERPTPPAAGALGHDRGRRRDDHRQRDLPGAGLRRRRGGLVYRNCARVGPGWGDLPLRRAVARRAGGGTAAIGRRVRLPAAGVRPADRLRLRLDPAVPGTGIGGRNLPRLCRVSQHRGTALADGRARGGRAGAPAGGRGGVPLGSRPGRVHRRRRGGEGCRDRNAGAGRVSPGTMATPDHWAAGRPPRIRRAGAAWAWRWLRPSGPTTESTT